MTKSLRTLFTLLLTTALFSCNDGPSKQTDKAEETPEALQDNMLSMKEYSRSGYDLVDELYSGLVDKSPELKKLEKELYGFETSWGETANNFNKFNSKSTNYYQSANLKATTITDSLLKKKILTLIENSQNQYTNRTAELNLLQDQIRKNAGTIKDHHAALKIILTLPIIEKYQTENLPENKKFKDLIKQQEKLIRRIDSLTPVN